MSDERVVIFIDGSNFYHGLKKHCRQANVDFLKFTEKLLSHRKLVRIYYYNVPVNQQEDPERYKDQQRFFSYLDRVPYLETKLGILVPRERTYRCSKCNHTEKINFHVEKGVDVKIGIDMLEMAYKNLYDTAILISGDGDFDMAIRAVKDTGRHVENAYFKGGHSYRLMKSCDKFIEINSDLMKGCWLKEKY